jgi:hypothetical protein
MRVIHYLKDGSRIEDITGHVVKMEDAATLYNMIRELNRKNENIHSIPGGNAGSVPTSQK